MADKKNSVNEEEKKNAKKLFLSMFTFQVRRANAKKDKTPYDFDKIPNPNKRIEDDPEHFYMLNILKQIFAEHEELKDEEKDKLLIIKVNEELTKKDYICGLAQYGSEREPKTEVNWNDTSDRKLIGDNKIVLRNFYFLIKLPKNEDKGCLILQRKGSSGIQKIFMTYLRQKLRLYPDFMYVYPEEFDRVPKEVEKYYKKGVSIGLNYVYEDISNDAFDNLPLKAKKYVIKILIENEEKKSPFALAKNLKRKLSFIKEKPVKVQINSDFKGSKKVFDIDEEGNAKPYVELTENLAKKDYNNNSLKFEAIDREAKKIMNNNFNEIWKGDMVE